MARSPLTDQYQRIMAVVDEIHNWTDDERNFLRDLFWPEVEEQPKRASKKTTKKAISGGCLRCRYKKNDVIHRDDDLPDYHEYVPKRKSKLSGIAAATAESIQRGEESQSKPLLCGTCGNERDYQDHSQPSPNFHEFDLGKSSSPALSVASKSQLKRIEAQSSTVNSGEVEASASNAAHAGS